MKYTSRVQKRRWPKRILFVAAILAGLIIGGTVMVRHVYFEGLKAVNENSQAVQLITIVPGSTIDEIASQLKKAGLIRSPWAFRLYASSKHVRDSLQAGTYSFSPSQSASQIIAQLTHGKVATDLVTIVPGQNLNQIRSALTNYGFAEAEVNAALDPKLYRGNPALVDKPDGASLEGYLYPESYQKDSSTTPKQIIEKALDEMHKQLTPDLRRAFSGQSLSVYEAITLASVVEKEVSKQEDRAQVAQVFLLRLKNNIALESDATKPSFNSYQNRGLPPVPISNVTASSLEAVANPANTDWLYFVSGDDGTTHFSHTLAEHEAKVAKYCHKLCGPR